jgi:hypothetical protein
MRFFPLSTNERANDGFTHAIEITADDLTTTATATAQTITCPYIFAVGDVCFKVASDLHPAFSDASDSAFNTTTMSVGDASGGVATILAAIETNINGTEILHKRAATSGAPLTGFTTAAALTVTFNSQTAKSLSNIDTGAVTIQLAINRLSDVYNAIQDGPILTK